MSGTIRLARCKSKGAGFYSFFLLWSFGPVIESVFASSEGAP